MRFQVNAVYTHLLRNVSIGERNGYAMCLYIEGTSLFECDEVNYHKEKNRPRTELKLQQMQMTETWKNT